MSITKQILKWTDKKYEEGVEENDTKKIMISGFVEGAIDGCVVCYPIVVAGCYYWKKRALKK